MPVKTVLFHLHDTKAGQRVSTKNSTGFPPIADPAGRVNDQGVGAYEGQHPNNGRKLLGSMSSTDAVRPPTGQIKNFYSSAVGTGTNTAAFGNVPNLILLPPAVVTPGNPTLVALDTPGGKQAVITSIFVSNLSPAQELPAVGFLWQLTLNNVPVTDLLSIGAPTLIEQAGFSPISPFGGPAAFTPNVLPIQALFAPLQNYIAEVDFDKILLFNYSAVFTLGVSGLWAANAARIRPINRGT